MKRILTLLVLALTLSPAFVRATPVTVTFNFTFDQNTSHPNETPFVGSVTVTLASIPGSAGYTSNGTVDAFSFNMPSFGLQAASTNYLKALFDGSGHMTYLLVSDRSDFILQTAGPRIEGYILGLKGSDLLTGTGITIGSNGSYFDYLVGGRGSLDIDYTFTTGNVAKVANPSAVPDGASTLGLVGLAIIGLATFRRRSAR